MRQPWSRLHAVVVPALAALRTTAYDHAACSTCSGPVLASEDDIVFKLSGVHHDSPVYPWHAVIAPVVAFFAGIAFAQAFYASSRAADVARGFGGHVDIELVVGVVMAGLVVIAFRVFGIAFRDAGVTVPTVRNAAILLAAIWGIGQLVLVAYNVATRQPFTIAAGWRSPVLSGQQLVFQFFAVAVIEESVFRGWLIPQIYRRLEGRYSERAALVGAVLIAATVFTLCHIPMLVVGSNESITTELLHIEVLALVYSLCYLRTGGIAVGIAFHVLGNVTASLIDSPLIAGDIFTVLFWLRLVAQPCLNTLAPQM